MPNPTYTLPVVNSTVDVDAFETSIQGVIDDVLSAPAISPRSQTYDIGSNDSITIAAHQTHFLQNTRFRLTENRDPYGAPAITIGNNANVDLVWVEGLAAADTIKNAVLITDRARVLRIYAEAEQQVENITNYDVSLINVTGSNVEIGWLQSTAFDKVLSVGGRFGDVSDAAGGADRFTMGRADIIGYQKAVQIKGSKGAHIGHLNAHTRSEYAEVNPGRNVLHLDDVQDSSFPSIFGKNSTEHGIYISGGDGDNDSGQNSSTGLTFGAVHLEDCWRCGVKNKSDYEGGAGGVNNEATDFTMSSLTVRGANTDPDNNDGIDDENNADGLRIENVQNVNIGSVHISPLDAGVSGTSCLYGVHLNGVGRAHIGSSYILGAETTALFMRTFRGNNGHLTMPDVYIQNAQSHAIHIDTDTGDNQRNIHVNARAVDVGGDLIRIEGDGAETPATARCYFDLQYTNVTGTLVNRISTETDIKVRLTDLGPSFAD